MSDWYCSPGSVEYNTWEERRDAILDLMVEKEILELLTFSDEGFHVNLTYLEYRKKSDG